MESTGMPSRTRMTTEEAGAVGDKVEDRAGEVSGHRLRLVPRRLVGLRLLLLLLRLAQYAAQCRTGPVGERRLFQHREVGAEHGR